MASYDVITLELQPRGGVVDIKDDRMVSWTDAGWLKALVCHVEIIGPGTTLLVDFLLEDKKCPSFGPFLGLGFLSGELRSI